AHATDAWRRHFEQLRPEDVAGWTSPEHFATPGSRRFGFWLKRSTDGGRSWSDPIAMASSSPKPPALLADGRLVSIGPTAVDREGNASRVVVEAAADQGRSWQTLATLPMFYGDDSPAYFVEPHVVEAEPGRLVALARFERGERLESRGISPLAMFVSDSA